ERIRTRGDLSTFPPRYARAARLVQHVLAYESIPQDLQDQVKNELGMPGLIELVTLAGQYRLIAGVLFAFDSPLPEGTPPPFRRGSIAFTDRDDVATGANAGAHRAGSGCARGRRYDSMAAWFA